MSDMEAIRQGLAANLAAFKDGDDGAQVSPYILEAPTPPTLHVMGPVADAERVDFGGQDEEEFIVVQGFAAMISDIGGQKRLDRWWANTGADSVLAAIETDKQLTSRLDEEGTLTTGQTAAVYDLTVIRKSRYLIFDIPQVGRVVGCEWTVKLLT